MKMISVEIKHFEDDMVVAQGKRRHGSHKLWVEINKHWWFMKMISIEIKHFKDNLVLVKGKRKHGSYKLWVEINKGENRLILKDSRMRLKNWRVIR